MFLQQGSEATAIASPLTSVHGSVWILAGIAAIFVAGRFLATLMGKFVIVGTLVALFVLMNGPGLTGSGVAERWNDVKAKAEAFWSGEEVEFSRSP